MKITIKETGKSEALSIIDENTGVDFIQDFIGNYGALSDGQFTFDEETGTYIADQDTFDWWDKVVTDQTALEARIAELKEEHGYEAVDEVVNEATSVDLEDLAAAVNKALDEEFGEPAGK
ncbi:hypothetical protein VK70_17120 [Paenibacillus durus ATCC 35681]|uniref:Uncharacterized protein n=2 Tax=Paenibacillus durus TaxID=44251 RepID=A0A0F7CKK6_PAEDU|nr:hypothetical protein VK70_17120 [Paenibacillus durus ATCC 35681]